MTVKKHGLGRGLDALLPVETTSADALLVRLLLLPALPGVNPTGSG
jgi:hypothetical protein